MKPLTGMQVHAIFAKQPNLKGLCGDSKDQKVFWECILDPSKGDKVKKALVKYKTLYPMILTISQLTGLENVFSPHISRGYWLGSNHALSRFKTLKVGMCLETLEKNLSVYGGEEEYVKKLISSAPGSGFLPLHAYIVLLSAKAQNLDNLFAVNNCIVRWGKIREVDSDKNVAKVELYNIQKRQNNILFLEPQVEEIEFDPLITPKLQVYQIVSIHQGMICTILNKNHQITLKKYTQQVLKIFNQG